jgi:outer membrane protein assembly factor BamB
MVLYRSHIAWSIAAISLLAPCDASTAATAKLLYKLTAPDGLKSTRFGTSLASVDGDILVGEPDRTDPVTGFSGFAYRFDSSTGVLKQTFGNPELTGESTFAKAITGGDGLVFVWLQWLEERVYVFDAATGSVLRTIEKPDPNSGGFGRGLTYDSGQLLVMAPSSGRGYLYDPFVNVLEQQIPSPEPNPYTWFGIDGAQTLFGDKAIISSPGRAWVFDRGTAEVLLTLDNPDTLSPENDAFGLAIAANGQIIAVGAPGDATGGTTQSGTVYVFDSNSGDLLHTLISPRSQLAGEFGRSLAVTPDGDILVGAWAEDVDGRVNVGRAYLFDGETGNLLLDIANPDEGIGTGFGWKVTAVDDLLVVGLSGFISGVPQVGEGIPTTGAAYVFAIVPEPSTVCLLPIAILFAGAQRGSMSPRGSFRKR